VKKSCGRRKEQEQKRVKAKTSRQRPRKESSKKNHPKTPKKQDKG
jgi:hypothetical protein